MNRKQKSILIVVLFIAAVMVMTGCESNQVGNRVIGGKDVQTFTYAYVRLGDKDIVEGYISSWRDYDNSDTVQVMIDGKYYLTHYSCVVMVADPAHGNLGYSVMPLQDRDHSN